MSWLKKDDEAISFAALQRNHDDDVVIFAKAILSHHAQTEAHLDEYLDQKPERQRWSFLKQLRQAIKTMRNEQPVRKGFFRFGHTQSDQEKDRQRADEKRISHILMRQEQRIVLQRKQQVKRWLAYILPVFNAQKQAIQRQVMEELQGDMKALGKELNAEGIKDFESFKAEQLGSLHADATEDVHHQQHQKAPHEH